MLRKSVAISFLLALLILLLQAEKWFVSSIMSSVMVALMIIADSFLFNEKTYKNWMEPVSISGAMAMLPWLGAPFLMDSFPSAKIFFLAVLGGVTCMAGFAFYFKAMCLDQDAVVITVMWSLAIAFVPIMAYFTLDEKFSSYQYLGIVLLFIGTLSASWKGTKSRMLVAGLMLLAVFLVSISTLIMREVFILLENGGGEVFFTGFICSTLGDGLVGYTVFVSMRSSQKSRLFRITQRYWPVFVAMELSQIIANGLSSLALSIGTASLVVATEGLTGGFVIAISILAVEIFKSNTRFSEAIEELKENFVDNIMRKSVGIVSIVIGAYLIG